MSPRTYPEYARRFDLSPYAEAAEPGWCIDRRHLFLLYNLLLARPFARVLEIGCYKGYSSTAFVQAINAGQPFAAEFCDIQIQPSLRKVLATCQHPERIVIHQRSSHDLLAGPANGPYDLVFVDGNHRLEAVGPEIVELLKRQTPCIVAHDTAASTAGYTDCEGAHYLKKAVQYEPGYYCLEDCEPRPDEATHRGFFVGVRENLELFEVVRAVFRAGT